MGVYSLHTGGGGGGGGKGVQLIVFVALVAHNSTEQTQLTWYLHVHVHGCHLFVKWLEKNNGKCSNENQFKILLVLGMPSVVL